MSSFKNLFKSPRKRYKSEYGFGWQLFELPLSKSDREIIEPLHMNLSRIKYWFLKRKQSQKLLFEEMETDYVLIYIDEDQKIIIPVGAGELVSHMESILSAFLLNCTCVACPQNEKPPYILDTQYNIWFNNKETKTKIIRLCSDCHKDITNCIDQHPNYVTNSIASKI